MTDSALVSQGTQMHDFMLYSAQEGGSPETISRQHNELVILVTIQFSDIWQCNHWIAREVYAVCKLLVPHVIPARKAS